jgi:hypothetical protein
MRVRVPRSLIDASGSPIIVDAVYFVVRVLRNALRGYQKVEVSTEPLPEARLLAERAIKEIEKAEQNPIVRINDNRIIEYISELQEFLESEATPDSESSLKDAEKVLQEMRTHRT